MTTDHDDKTSPFPVDWHEWRAAWATWLVAHGAPLVPTGYHFPRKNFLADAVLGVWAIHGRPVELSEVTFPDFSKGYGADHVRFIGVTYGELDGTTTAGPVVSTFAELEAELGMISE